MGFEDLIRNAEITEDKEEACRLLKILEGLNSEFKETRLNNNRNLYIESIKVLEKRIKAGELFLDSAVNIINDDGEIIISGKLRGVLIFLKTICNYE